METGLVKEGSGLWSTSMSSSGRRVWRSRLSIVISRFWTRFFVGMMAETDGWSTICIVMLELGALQSRITKARPSTVVNTHRSVNRILHLGNDVGFLVVSGASFGASYCSSSSIVEG